MIRRPARFLLAALVLGSISALLVRDVASAATQVLTVTPSTTRPTLRPGSSQSGSFQVINQGESTYQLQVYTSAYSVKTEAYTPDFSPIPGQPNTADWIQLAPSQATIKPDQSLDVHYTITVPTGTSPGGYYAVAFAETKSSQPRHGVVINERVGEIFYINVAGPVKKSGKLLSWSSPLVQSSPIKAALRLENDGGIDYFSDINTTVSDLFGNTKFALATQKAVLPQTIRNIPVEWDKAPALGLFKIQGTATIFGKTEQLPTKYVLVTSKPIRIAFLVIILVLLSWLVGRFFARRRQRSKPGFRQKR